MAEPMLLGSKEWFETAKDRLNESKDLMKAAKDWEGAMRCLIKVEDDVAVKDFASRDGVEAILGMLSMLSDEDRLLYKGTGLGNLLEKLGIPIDSDLSKVDVEETTKKIESFTINDFKDVVIFASFKPHRGVLEEMDPISPTKYEDAPFSLTGGYKSWKALCSGKQSALQLIMSGKMKLTGNTQYIMKRMGAVNALMAVYKSIPLK